MLTLTIGIEAAAAIAHAANKAYCEVVLHDFSHPSWNDLPEESKLSVKRGVVRVLDGASAEQLHDEWAKEKFLEGWMYGAVKSVEKKTHPCLQPYSLLTEADRKKDELFRGIVRTFVCGWASGAVPFDP